jgi:hypothetical protein
MLSMFSLLIATKRTIFPTLIYRLELKFPVHPWGFCTTYTRYESFFELYQLPINSDNSIVAFESPIKLNYWILEKTNIARLHF